METVKWFPSNTFNIVISGKESVSFVDQVSNKKIEKNKVILNCLLNMNEVDDKKYPIEKKLFPFSLLLPEYLPTSFDCLMNKENKARIHYNIWAGLVNKKKNKYFFTNQEFIVNETFSQRYEVKRNN